jgi:hypothetical protein
MPYLSVSMPNIAPQNDRRILPAHHLGDFTAENALIEVEGLLAFAAGEEKVRRKFHVHSSCALGARWASEPGLAAGFGL